MGDYSGVSALGRGFCGLLLVAVGFPALAIANELDPSFGNGGVASVSVVDANAGADPVVLTVQPDGGLVVVTREGAGDLAVFRFESDGSLDEGFGVSGKALVDLGGDDIPADVVSQPDGGILIAAVSELGGNDRLGLVRLSALGALDPTFGSGGVRIESFAVHTNAQRIELLSDGSLVVVGEIRSCCPRGFPGQGAFVAKFSPSGDLDPSFASGGVWARPGEVSFGSLFVGMALYDVAIQPDGGIISVGIDYIAETQGPSYSGSWVVYRLASDGSVDSTFGDGGIAYVFLPPGSSAGSWSGYDARGVSLLSDGRVLVGGGNGLSGFRTSDSFFLAMLTGEGELDTAWGSQGFSELRPYPRPPFWPVLPDPARASAFHLLRASDGGWFLVGVGSPDVSDSVESALVLRFQADGSPDPAWSADGVQEVAGFAKWITVDAVLSSDEKLILAVRSEGTIELRRLLGYTPCGNGVAEPWEECDDGNAADGDCCSAECRFEAFEAPCPDDGNSCTADRCDGSGLCTHPDLSDGTSCDDGDLCSQADVCAAGICLGEFRPRDVCRETTTSVLVLRAGGGARNKLSWTWKKGAEVGASEIAPQVQSLCVYDESPEALVSSLDVPGLPCGEDHCFRTNSRKTLYSSKRSAFDGVRKLILVAGEAGRSSAKLKAQGENLPMPGLPLQAPVVTQLRGENGLCLEARYPLPSRNDATLFRAKANAGNGG